METSLQIDFAGDPAMQAELNTRLVGSGLRVLSFAEQETDLEDIFMKVTKGLVQ